MMNKPVYLDYNATTPVDPDVMETMKPYFCELFANAASVNHSLGLQARDAVETARSQVAQIIGADAKEIVFTSGATESNNLAIKGLAQGSASDRGNHIITSASEHKAVIDPCKRLAGSGFDVTWLAPDKYGTIRPEQVEEAITKNAEKTILVSIMAANNEIGTINPIEQIAAVTKSHGVLFHCDATQAIGKFPVDVERMGIDLLSFSAHKIYGPKGIGALYVRRGELAKKLACQIDGGGHENGMRSGTLNVPGIVGMGKACEIASRRMAQDTENIKKLRDRLHEGITSRVEKVHLNGHPSERLTNTLNLAFAYVEGEAMIARMRDVAVSTGSACTSATIEPSHVLTAIGVGDDLIHGSIRFSLGRYTTEEEIDYTIERVVKSVENLRKLSPFC